MLPLNQLVTDTTSIFIRLITRLLHWFIPTQSCPRIWFSRFKSLTRIGLLLLLFVSHSFSVRSQGDSVAFRQQVKFTCDNNFFLLNGDDGYYTSGMFLAYSRLLSKHASNTRKRILSAEIGQEIYNAHSRKILPRPNVALNIPGGLEQIDRPIAGYLFGKVSHTRFYADRSLLKLGISIGSIGKNSFGQDVQEYWHKVIGVKDYWNWVWDYQVSNEWGGNLHSTFAYALLDIRQRSSVQVTSISQATIGTINTNLSQAFLLQIGKLRPLSSSTYWDSRLYQTSAPSENHIEWFFFCKPEIKYQVYNATIEGGMFTDDKGPILSDISPFVLSNEFGLRFSLPRFSLGYTIVFQTREAQSQFHTQSYASIVGSFCF